MLTRTAEGAGNGVCVVMGASVVSVVAEPTLASLAVMPPLSLR